MAACVPATLVRSVLATPLTVSPKHGGLVAVHADGQLRPALLAAEPDVGDARRLQHDVARLEGEAPRVVEVVAADLERQPRVAAAAEHPAQDEVAARGPGPDDHAGQPGQLPTEILGDLVVACARVVMSRAPDRLMRRFHLSRLSA